MADNEAEGAADGAEAAPSKNGKLKLMIAVVGFVAILGAGAGWFFLMRGHGEEAHAEAPPPKPPSFVEVPDMMVNLVGAPGERVQYLKVKIVLEIKDDKHVEAIKPTLELFNLAKSKGVAVFFITGRRENTRDHTVSNLKREGFDGFTQLILKPQASTETTVQYKSGARAAIEQQGYHIIANVGDQYSDLAGGHEDIGFKLANPFYFLP